MRYLLLVAILASSTLGSGKEPSRVVASEANYKEKIGVEKQALLEAEIKKRGILGTLYEINKEMNRLTSDMKNVDDQLSASRKSIRSYVQVITRLENIKLRQKTFLKARLRAIYKLGLRGYTQTLLSSRSSSEFFQNLKFLKLMAEKDQELILNYKTNLDMLQAQEKKLRDQVKVYLQFQHLLAKERKSYEDQKLKQVALLSDIERDRETHLRAFHELREVGRKFEEQLVELGLRPSVSQEMSRGPFFEQKGSLKPPVFRPILQKYGIIKNARFNTQIFHKGLFFAAEPGDKVSSMFWGTVAFAGWINGYGETIILDHGDHYYSVYAHNAHLEKKSGDSVGLGETIAETGDTGSLRGPGLYLEIRHFSESLDPLPWLDLPKTTRL